MSRRPEGTAEPEAAAPPTGKRNRFIGSDHELEQFGLTIDEEYVKQGYVPTDRVRALLDELGLHDRKHIEFPFTHMRRKGYESWSLRIEPTTTHQVKGELVNAHHWVYKRELPEVVASQQ